MRKKDNSGGKASRSVARFGVDIRVGVTGFHAGKLAKISRTDLSIRHINVREEKGQAILLGLVLLICNVLIPFSSSAIALSDGIAAASASGDLRSSSQLRGTILRPATLALGERGSSSFQSAGTILRPAAFVSEVSATGGDTSTGREFRALWVLRSVLVSRTEIDRMLRRAKQTGFNVLFVQVRGRGDAFYKSSLEPRAALLTDSEFDPLAYLISQAHRDGFQVHVWLNTFLVWSAPWHPTNVLHAMVSHPDWVAVRSDGRSLSELSRDEIEAMGIEGVFLAPGNPEVREHVRAVVRELVRNYDVEGVHLDYIRYPNMSVGYDAGTRTEFMRRYGVDPVQIANRKNDVIGLLGVKGLSDLAVLWEKWRISSVDALVDSVRCDLKALDPEVKLSAAVIADSRSALTRHAQDWPSWLKRGALDFAVPMCYSASTRFVMNQVRDIKNMVGDETFYPGIAIYNQSPGRVVEKVRVLRNMGIKGFSMFCYDSEHPRNFVLEELSRTVFADRY